MLNKLCLNCNSTCPLPQRILLSKRTSRLYESLQWSRAAPILHQQSDFEFWRVIFRPLTSLFSKISSFSNFPRHGPKPWADYRFFHSLWIALRFCIHQAMISERVGKLVLAKTNWFFHPKIRLFQKFSPNRLCLNCHSTCPLAHRVLLSKRTSRLYESFFLSLWIELRFCIHQGMSLVGVRKI